MSFQAYLANIKTKTGKSADELVKQATAKGILHDKTKAGDLVKWLKENFDLGQGHSMAIWKVFQEGKEQGGKEQGGKEARGKVAKPKTKSATTVKSKPETENTKPRTVNNPVDKYIAAFPKETQALLEKMRATIKKWAPDAEETMGYGIPTFKLNGNLVHFASYKKHIGFYPAPSAIKEFSEELSKYEGAKGSVQFPVNKPLPLGLVTKIVKFRVKENKAKKK